MKAKKVKRIISIGGNIEEAVINLDEIVSIRQVATRDNKPRVEISFHNKDIWLCEGVIEDFIDTHTGQ